MQPWQKTLPIHLESKLKPEAKKELYRSGLFRPKQATKDYQLVASADYGDYCKNGINRLHVRVRVCLAGSKVESAHFGLDDVPAELLVWIGRFREMQKWNGCTTAGPWYYIENPVFMAGDRDCNGAEKGQYKQIRNGKTGLPSWHLVAIDPDGVEMPIHTLSNIYPDSATKPTGEYRVEWRPWYRIGEGKTRELDHARSVAIWPDATDEDLIAPGLEDRLKARLPALLVEFRGVVESLGFEW